MADGRVEAIYTSPVKGTPMVESPSVRVIPGKGIDGDRFFDATGTRSAKQGAFREITLIEIEAIVAAQRDYGVELAPGETRRNVITRGVPLNHLVGREFHVGAIRLRGLQLCDPCTHLEKLTRKGVKDALENRGGLCAQILDEGEIKPGDAIRW